MLFGKLQQGVQENQQILTVARMRADAEELYSNSLAGITPATERVAGGFSRDEGASVRKVSPSMPLTANAITDRVRLMKACVPKWKLPLLTIARLPPTSVSLL